MWPSDAIVWLTTANPQFISNIKIRVSTGRVQLITCPHPAVMVTTYSVSARLCCKDGRGLIFVRIKESFSWVQGALRMLQGKGTLYQELSFNVYLWKQAEAEL